MTGVYYVRRGSLIKIGSSNNIGRRLRELKGTLLAVEPPSKGKTLIGLERLRQAQFRAARPDRRREWFYATSDLLAHIAALNDGTAPPPPWLPEPGTRAFRRAVAELVKAAS